MSVRSNPKHTGNRSVAARARACLLLLCLLLGPMQGMAGVILHKIGDCCSTTMCPMHSHSAQKTEKTQTPKPEDTERSGMCHHEEEKQAPDCSMKSCCPSDDNAGRLPALPEIAITPSVSASLPFATDFVAFLQPAGLPTIFVSPPDQPPRA